MRVLRYGDLKQFGIPWTRTHLRRLQRAGRFPHHVQLGERTIGWLADEIDGWLRARAAAR